MLARVALFGVCCCLFLTTTACPSTDGPPPRPVPVLGADCATTCHNLVDVLACPWAKPRSGTCEDACATALANAFPYDTACLTGASSCDAARQCKGMGKQAPTPAPSKPAGPAPVVQP